MKPRVMLSPLTGRAYVLTQYVDDTGSGQVVAQNKHDVTDDVVHDLMAAAWARGWNECNAAAEGDAPPNPYRPAHPAPTSTGAGTARDTGERAGGEG